MPKVQPTEWDYKDTLRQMTEKFNKSVQAIIELQESSEDVNAATVQSISDMQTSINSELESIKEDLKSKIDNVTAEDLNLGNVDNTADIDKPVSRATQEAIELATKDMATTEEAGDEFKTENLYDPEISAPIKMYIENRIAELFNAYQNNVYTPDYRIATEDRLGVIKSGSIAKVNPNTGLIEIPKLEDIDSELTKINTTINSLTESLESNNLATSTLEKNQGNLNTLSTITKTSLTLAINELVDKLSEILDNNESDNTGN